MQVSISLSNHLHVTRAVRQKCTLIGVAEQPELVAKVKRANFHFSFLGISILLYTQMEEEIVKDIETDIKTPLERISVPLIDERLYQSEVHKIGESLAKVRLPYCSVFGT